MKKGEANNLSFFLLRTLPFTRLITNCKLLRARSYFSMETSL